MRLAPRSPGASPTISRRASLVPNDGTAWLNFAGPALARQANLFLRLQRVGQEIAGFYSRDGRIWTQAGFSPQTLPTLKAEALFGLAVSADYTDRINTGRFSQVTVLPDVSAYGIRAAAGDRAVTLQWRVPRISASPKRNCEPPFAVQRLIRRSSRSPERSQWRCWLV